MQITMKLCILGFLMDFMSAFVSFIYFYLVPFLYKNQCSENGKIMLVDFRSQLIKCKFHLDY